MRLKILRNKCELWMKEFPLKGNIIDELHLRKIVEKQV